MSASPIFVGSAKPAFIQILPAATTTLVTLLTAAAAGSKVVGITITSTDTADRVVQLYVTRGGVDILLSTVAVPLNSGTTNALPAVNGMSTTNLPGLPTDNDGQRYLLLQMGDVLKAAVTVTVTAAKAINFNVQAGDF